MNRVQVLTLLTLAAVVAAGVVPAAAGLSTTDGSQATRASAQDDPNPDGGDQGTPWLAPGTGGKANQGREDNEKQQYPGNTSFRIDNHAPGATGNSYNIFAVGFSENIRMHWNVVKQTDFRWDQCTSTDATAFGVDRGNDDPGTGTDQSLLNSYKSVTYTQDGIYVEFYKENALAGSPVNISVNDQIVSRVTNCLQNPSEPGWYRMTGYINGSTKMDATTEFTIYGASKYVYVCENCNSRQQAIEKLGPPPTTCPPSDEFSMDSKEWTCRTEDGEYYTRSDSPSGGGSTATPASGTPSDATATPTPTPTSGQQQDQNGGETTTPTETPDGASTAAPTATATAATSGPTPTSTQGPGGSGNGNGSTGTSQGGDGSPTGTVATGSDDGGTAAGDESQTPTAGSGPGFGVVAALAAAAAALLARRHR